MSAGIFITTKDICIVEECHINTARNRMRVLKCILEKQSHQRITIREYCKYEGITVEEFQQAVHYKTKQFKPSVNN